MGSGPVPPAAIVTGAFPSPNHGDRRGHRPELIVLHYTGMASTPEARARLCDPAAEVSAHWLICEDGMAEALVPEDRRAWHAGAGAWQDRVDVNSRSIGIEIANPGDRPFAARQMDALVALLRDIMDRWQIGPEGVIGHSDMAPGRKIDPGPRGHPSCRLPVAFPTMGIRPGNCRGSPHRRRAGRAERRNRPPDGTSRIVNILTSHQNG